MSALKRNNETELENLKKPKTELVTGQDAILESEKKSVVSTSKEWMGNNFEGLHELQVLDGETDLHKHRKQCTKNPGHPEFIPIESFSLKHLPEGYQDTELYEYIKAAANLTVWLKVTTISPERPEFWPNTNHPYPLSGMRGKKIPMNGSGKVKEVRRLTAEDKQATYKTCICKQCKASDKPNKVWWQIYINTAAHVVVDAIEASHTAVRFFYDRDDDEKVIIDDAISVFDVDVEEDWCEIICVTCDEHLANKLEAMRKHFDEVWWKVQDKYYETRDIHKLNFIVSHPHGCSKQVSVGHWKEKVDIETDYEDVSKFAYTTCTCPGSSGANVHCVGYTGWYIDHVHSGMLKSGLNISGLGYNQ